MHCESYCQAVTKQRQNFSCHFEMEQIDKWKEMFSSWKRWKMKQKIEHRERAGKTHVVGILTHFDSKGEIKTRYNNISSKKSCKNILKGSLPRVVCTCVFMNKLSQQICKREGWHQVDFCCMFLLFYKGKYIQKQALEQPTNWLL